MMCEWSERAGGRRTFLYQTDSNRLIASKESSLCLLNASCLVNLVNLVNLVSMFSKHLDGHLVTHTNSEYHFQ